MIAPGFTGSTLDRADALRHDPDGVAAAMRDPGACLLALGPAWEPVIEDGRLAWTSFADVPANADFALLGLDEGRPRFLALTPSVGASHRSPAMMTALDALEGGDGATYAAARSLLQWHARNRFCANCGHATRVFRAGWGRACPNCAASAISRATASSIDSPGSRKPASAE
jgi:NAD+ diphosphatase